jgi:hypothetical protein
MKPVVATTVEGLPEIQHDQTGYLGPPLNPTSWGNKIRSQARQGALYAYPKAKAIVRLLKDFDASSAPMGGGRSTTECSPDAVTEKTGRVYQQALADFNGVQDNPLAVPQGNKGSDYVRAGLSCEMLVSKVLLRGPQTDFSPCR